LPDGDPLHRHCGAAAGPGIHTVVFDLLSRAIRSRIQRLFALACVFFARGLIADMRWGLFRISHHTGKTGNRVSGGADIPVCQIFTVSGGRQECLPHRGEKWGLFHFMGYYFQDSLLTSLQEPSERFQRQPVERSGKGRQRQGRKQSDRVGGKPMELAAEQP
jgi:hypothetical protein